jgi:integrase
MQAPRHRFTCEETMARSHQRGTVRLEHKSWVGFINLKVLDPTTGESTWKKQRVGVLGAKSKMTKHQAQDSLEEILAQRTGGTTQPRADERIVTLAWFTRNRFFPLREGSAWRQETAAIRKSEIEHDVLARLGDLPLAKIDKVMLQDAPERFGEDVVACARSARPLLLQGDLRGGDRAGSRPEKSGTKADPAQWSAGARQDYAELEPAAASTGVGTAPRLHPAELDMTETFRPSELFALRWRGFDMDARTLTVSQTAYKGKLRDFGKTKKSLRTVHLPQGLATELWLWKQECPDRSPEAFIFPNARKRNGSKTNGFIRTDNYRARVLKKLAAKLGLAKLNFQVLRRTMATLAQTKGGVKDVQGVLGHSKADTTVNVYMQPIEAGVKSTLDAIYLELTAREEVAAGS